MLRHLVVHDSRLGPTQAERLEETNRRLLHFYSSQPGGNRMPPLKLQNLASKGWGLLHGRTVKAANCRALAPFLMELAMALYDNNEDEYHRCVRRLTGGMVRFFDLIYSAGVFLDTQQVDELRRIVLRVGAAYQQLRNLACDQRELLWNVVPKIHMFMHLSSQAAIVNIRWTQAYAEESQIGSTTRVWTRSAHGRYRRRVQRVVLLKRLVAFVTRLSQSDLT